MAGFVEKIRGLLGGSGRSVDVSAPESVAQGASFDVSITLSGFDDDEIESIALSLAVAGERDGDRITVVEETVSRRALTDAESGAVRATATLDLPTHAPISTGSGAVLTVDVRGGPTVTEAMQVTPGPRLQAVLDATEAVGLVRTNHETTDDPDRDALPGAVTRAEYVELFTFTPSDQSLPSSVASVRFVPHYAQDKLTGETSRVDAYFLLEHEDGTRSGWDHVSVRDPDDDVVGNLRALIERNG